MTGSMRKTPNALNTREQGKEEATKEEEMDGWRKGERMGRKGGGERNGGR